MPQLEPSPWFMILIFTWLIFTIIVMPKVMTYKFPNEPDPQDHETLKTTSWNWKWY